MTHDRPAPAGTDTTAAVEASMTNDDRDDR